PEAHPTVCKSDLLDHSCRVRLVLIFYCYHQHSDLPMRGAFSWQPVHGPVLIAWLLVSSQLLYSLRALSYQGCHGETSSHCFETTCQMIRHTYQPPKVFFFSS